MKTYLISFILLFFIGCQKGDNSVYPTDDSTFGIFLLKDQTLTIDQIQDINIKQLELESEPWLSSNDIDFYDYSTHFIYLKKTRSELFTDETNIKFNNQPFVLFANNFRCYVGTFHSIASSSMPIKPYIDNLGFYPQDILPILKAPGDDADLRNNANLELDLKTKNKLHRGLFLLLNNVSLISNLDTATVLYSYSITNNDEDNLYVLDPDKMGSSLFHYFTNGIDFWNGNKYFYSQYKKVEEPQPFDSWKSEWFVKIVSGATIERTVLLKGYLHIPGGLYRCTFDFSNPNMIEKSDRVLPEGRYWLGDIQAEITKNIN